MSRARPGERRELILQTLARMLQERQGERITTAELARAVGVSEAALYRHFPSKARMFEALLEFIEESLFARINRIAAEEPDIAVEELVELARHPRVVAIGEAGLDYHYDHSPRDVQKKSFRTHITAARETGLPLVIHARDADADIARMLEEESRKGAFPFVLHCFTGGADLARRGLALGGYISFSGVVTFKNAEALRDIALAVPSDRFLVETDAPYLAPEPFRGKTNEPAFVVETAKRLAALRGVRESEMARLTTENFFRLFKKVPRAAGKASQSAA